MLINATPVGGSRKHHDITETVSQLSNNEGYSLDTAWACGWAFDGIPPAFQLIRVYQTGGKIHSNHLAGRSHTPGSQDSRAPGEPMIRPPKYHLLPNWVCTQRILPRAFFQKTSPRIASGCTLFRRPPSVYPISNDHTWKALTKLATERQAQNT
jgi:hypothetical protein